MPQTFVIECPAKLNLFLAVGPPDASGYHPLRTIFQAIDLCDTLEIEVGSPSPGFFCADPMVPLDNTVTRARALLSELMSLPPMRIELTKRIPAESGLGGGSSDAAGLLLAAGTIAGRPTAMRDLMGIASAVGADVPFFLLGGRARAEGYGERLSSLPDGRRQWVVVARPAVGCPTGAMYRRLDSISYAWRDFPDDVATLYNDFLRVAPNECLTLIERLCQLGAADSTLAGSGSAVFGLFPDEVSARAAARRLIEEGVPFVWFGQTRPR